MSYKLFIAPNNSSINRIITEKRQDDIESISTKGYIFEIDTHPAGISMEHIF